MRKIVLLGQEIIKLCALFQPTISRLAVPGGDKTHSDIRVYTGAMRTAPMADILSFKHQFSAHSGQKRGFFERSESSCSKI